MMLQGGYMSRIIMNEPNQDIGNTDYQDMGNTLLTKEVKPMPWKGATVT
jgi:hypothetical protein